MSDQKRARRLGTTTLEYLSLAPLDLNSAVSLYGGFLRFGWESLLRTPAPRTVGECIRADEPLNIRSTGSRFLVRPESEDLGFLTPSHKELVRECFEPQANETVIDIGAHIGYYSVLSASMGARVIAFEPSVDTCKLLRENVRRNFLQNVQVYQLALGSEDGLAELHEVGRFSGVSSLGPAMVILGEDPHSEEVQVRRLDSIEEVAKHSVIDWMLVDTEGWEAEVLRGGLATLNKTKKLIVEVEYGPNAVQCESMIRGAGLSILRRYEQSDVNEYWYCHRQEI